MDKRQRYFFIDSLRGLAVVNMVIFHFLWDLRYIAGIKEIALSSTAAFVWQQAICHTFIFISGFCFLLSRRPLKNGIITFLSGAAVTAATLIFMPDSAIFFGVLTLLGSAMLILTPIRKLLVKVPAILGFFISLILFWLSYGIADGSIVFGLLKMPDFLYKNMLTAFFGFPPADFFSTDYFPLFPWLYLILTGFFLSLAVKKYGSPKFLFLKIPVFEWIGRKALIIYLAHQPILYGITLLIIKVI